MKIEYIEFNVLGDNRGSLIALEEENEVPFQIKRVYYIFDTQVNVKRGLHAHKELEQLMICINGSCKLSLDDGQTKLEILLDTPSKGIRIRKMIWHEMYEFSQDCILMVLADDFYSESDYIRNYLEFQKAYEMKRDSN
ncbi:MAG: dTDP-6-deoxy-3,4-keto-hexulose isomerase [Candidatus Cloacimonadota bacterium]|nr:MAG: dTDP-6-deoxy-3,4-keto-hexulose isomerase [Candidatus Cloacimonadota bacterium]